MHLSLLLLLHTFSMQHIVLLHLLLLCVFCYVLLIFMLPACWSCTFDRTNVDHVAAALGAKSLFDSPSTVKVWDTSTYKSTHTQKNNKTKGWCRWQRYVSFFGKWRHRIEYLQSGIHLVFSCIVCLHSQSQCLQSLCAWCGLWSWWVCVGVSVYP